MKNQIEKNFEKNFLGNKIVRNLFAATIIVLLFSSYAFSVDTISTGSSLRATLLNQEPYPATPGSYVTLRFKLENIGIKNIKNLHVRIVPRYPFSLADDELKYIGNIGGMQMNDYGTTIQYRLKVDKDAYPGYFDVDLEYTIDNYTWIKVSGFSIKVESTDVRVGITSVSTQPKFIKPGEEGILSINITNFGDTLIKDITLKLDLTLSSLSQTQLSLLSSAGFQVPFSPIDTSTEQKIKNIMPSETKQFVFKIMTASSATSNVYKIPVIITYYDVDNQKYENHDLISLFVGGKPELRASIEKSEVLFQNQKGKITLKVINSGKIDAKFTEVYLEDGKNFVVLSNKYDYIGDIDSDDYETVEFTIFVENAKDYLELPVKMKFEDSLGNKYEQTETVNLRLYTPQEARKYKLVKTSSAFGILIFLVIVGVGYFIYKKRKHRQKAKQA
ncbi:MAG: COG1361 S-layer family protein [Candidatus Woesearchaeota archaeon]